MTKQDLHQMLAEIELTDDVRQNVTEVINSFANEELTEDEVAELVEYLDLASENEVVLAGALKEAADLADQYVTDMDRNQEDLTTNTIGKMHDTLVQATTLAD